MSYSRYRQDYTIRLLAGSVRTNTMILDSYFIAPGKTITIFGLRCYMSTAGTASTTITLNQDGGATLATLITSAGGHAVWNLTEPLTVVGAAAGSRLQLTQNVTDVAGIGTLCLDMEKPFP